MSKKRNEVMFREFLNTSEHGGSAYVKFRVNYRVGRINASFTVADCNDMASLEFYWSDSKFPTNELAKIQMLKRAILEFEEAYVSAVDKRMKYIEMRKKKRKKKK